MLFKTTSGGTTFMLWWTATFAAWSVIYGSTLGAIFQALVGLYFILMHSKKDE